MGNVIKKIHPKKSLKSWETKYPQNVGPRTHGLYVSHRHDKAKYNLTRFSFNHQKMISGCPVGQLLKVQCWDCDPLSHWLVSLQVGGAKGHQKRRNTWGNQQHWQHLGLVCHAAFKDPLVSGALSRSPETPFGYL